MIKIKSKTTRLGFDATKELYCAIKSWLRNNSLELETAITLQLIAEQIKGKKQAEIKTGE